MTTTKQGKSGKKGAVELSETELDQTSAAGAFKGVDGLSVEQEVIEYQDGDDLFLRKKK